MRDHILDLYKGVTGVHSFVTEEGQYVDCVPIDRQPSLRRPDGTYEKVATPPLPMATPVGAPSPAPAPVPMADAHGNVRRCPNGTIPMRRLTLESMTNFETLEEFLQKQPKKASGLRATEQHYYAYAMQAVDNFGGSSVLNIWAPVPTAGEFSLSQNWFVGGSGSGTQTIEAGWQVYPDKYGSSQPCLFIFWTPDDYNPSGPSAYNLDKPGFVQTDPTWVLGGAFTSTSVKGGAQYELQLQWFRDLVFGHWWLYASYPPDAPAAVGYHPRALFGSGQMASNAQFIKFGGK